MKIENCMSVGIPCGVCNFETSIDGLALKFFKARKHYPRWCENPPKRKHGRGHFELCMPVKAFRALVKREGVSIWHIDEWLDIQPVRIPMGSKETDCYIYPLTPDRYFDIEKMKEKKK